MDIDSVKRIAVQCGLETGIRVNTLRSSSYIILFVGLGKVRVEFVKEGDII